MTNSIRSTRFETHTPLGPRQGVKSCALIGRKLASIYQVPADASDAIDSLLREIEKKTRT